jgi:hypothetical protein
MIVLAIAAAVTLRMQDEPKSLREQIGAPYDAGNGYFDYLEAGDIVRAAGYSNLEREFIEIVNAPTKTKGRAERLAELRPRMAQIAEQAMVRVRIGNQKPLWEPRLNLEISSLFPEYAAFKLVAKAGRQAIQYRLSQGDTRGAARLVADGLAFSSRIGTGPIISFLVALATDAIYLAAIEPYLTSFSEADLRVIADAAMAYLARPPMFRRMAEAETRFFSEYVTMVSGEVKNQPEEAGEEETDAATEYLRKLTPDRLQRIADEIRRRMLLADEKELKVLESPESNWYTKIRLTDASSGDFAEKVEPPPKTDQEWIDSILSSRISLFQVIEPVGMRRTQARLLLLHTKILQYRWSYGRLPKTLKEVDASIDPFSGKAFGYEVSGSNYRLWSEGRGPRGEIELRYRRAKTVGTTAVGDGPP